MVHGFTCIIRWSASYFITAFAHAITVVKGRRKMACCFSGAAIQTMECLKLFEHMASTMAECMAVVTREFGVPKTTQDVLRYALLCMMKIYTEFNQATLLRPIGQIHGTEYW